MIENIKKLKYIKLHEIMGCFIFICMIIPSWGLKIYNKFKKRNLWLISEMKDTCRDNGYHFFKYIRENHPYDSAYYVIDKKSDDYKKIKKYDKYIIRYGGLKFWLYYMSANVNIGTNKAFDPDHPLFYCLRKYFNLYTNCVFLQHGVIKDDIPMFYYKNCKYRLFICGARPEYEFIKERFGYPEENIVYTGLARFDNLHNPNINNKQILIMPTWRNWLGREVNFLGSIENFKDTDYYKYWNGLINSNEFISYIEENGLIVKFYPHYHMSKYLNDFSSKSSNIKIINNSDEDIQKLLKESAILITDFSSVFMDFAYMQKPIIYFQFDKMEYRKKQLQQGYYEYEKNGFGDVVESIDDVISKLKDYKLKYIPKDIYRKRMNDFFELRDMKNCERIYNEIKKIC